MQDFSIATNTSFAIRRPSFMDTIGSFVNKSILLKGSRAFGFEKISHALEQRTHTTVLEVNLDNMIHNLNYYRSLLRPNVRIMIMDKASGYGTGTYEVASMLQHQGVSFFGRCLCR